MTPTLYRWEPGPDDCRRHDGPHESQYCNGAVGRYIEAEAADLDVARLARAAALLREAGSIIRELSNALLWCDTRYRQTLEGHAVRDIPELRAEIQSVSGAAGRTLARLAAEEAADG